jgi:hypothetical protein
MNEKNGFSIGDLAKAKGQVCETPKDESIYVEQAFSKSNEIRWIIHSGYGPFPPRYRKLGFWLIRLLITAGAGMLTFACRCGRCLCPSSPSPFRGFYGRHSQKQSMTRRSKRTKPSQICEFEPN